MAPRWKLAVVTAVGLYPLVLFLFPLLGSLTAGLPSWLGQLVTVSLATPLMTWCIVPSLTRLLGRWLTPAAEHGEGPRRRSAL